MPQLELEVYCKMLTQKYVALEKQFNDLKEQYDSLGKKYNEKTELYNKLQKDHTELVVTNRELTRILLSSKEFKHTEAYKNFQNRIKKLVARVKKLERIRDELTAKLNHVEGTEHIPLPELDYFEDPDDFQPDSYNEDLPKENNSEQ